MSTPAAAFVEHRNHYLQAAGIDKQAADGGFDWSGLANQVGQFAQNNPELAGGLGGAGLGALSGLFSDRSGSVLRNALIGGGLGAGLGYGYRKLPQGAEKAHPGGTQSSLGPVPPKTPEAFQARQQGWDKAPTLQFPKGQNSLLGDTKFTNPEAKTQLDEKDRGALARMELNANKGLGASESASRNLKADELLEWGKGQGLLNPSFARSLTFSPEEKALSEELAKLDSSYRQAESPDVNDLAAAEGLLKGWDTTKNVGRNVAALPGQAVDAVRSGIANESQSSAAAEAAKRMQEEAARAEFMQKLEELRKFNQ